MIKPYLREFKPYPPGKPIEELRRELGLKGPIIKLASNENPLGPSPRALEAIKKALPHLHRYPDAAAYELRRALAIRYGVEPEEVVLGNGSNEVIDLLVKACVREGEEILMSEPSFLMYEKFAQAAGARVRKVPLKERRHHLEAIAELVGERTRLIFLDHPHNPTGSILTHQEVSSWLKELPKDLIVVIDEAYGEFIREEGAVNPLSFKENQPPVVLLRTFSKAYGLAALRIGYGLMKRELADVLNTIRQPFNVNTLAQVAAKASLEDEDYLRRVKETVWRGLDYLSEALKELGLTPYPSQANFLLVDLGRRAQPIYEALLRRGIIVRSMEAYGFPTCLRITVGLPEENEALVKALKEVLDET